tara:strand:- start:15924 stop:17204 length:1281 start_codon:yes stop_codon:yes gene_type:complete
MPTYTIPKQELIFLNNTEGKHVKIYENKNDPNHKIIRYIKDKLETDEDYSMYGKYRSVIVDKDNYVVGFSPPKSISFDSFIKKNSFDGIKVEELIEGTMINLFYDGYKKEWNIATRSNIGANNKFVQEEEIDSFRTMFLEACNEIGLDFEQLPKIGEDENIYYSYSFVLQHPKNRIVSRTKDNKCFIFLVEMYQFIRKEKETIIYTVDTSKFLDLLSNLGISIPTDLVLSNSINDYDTLMKLTCSDFNDSWSKKDFTCFGGFMIKNKDTNVRTKIRDEHYEHIRKLRGNQIKPKYHYLSLRKQKRLQEYLNFYPEDKKKYDVYRQEISDYAYNLWQSYIGCYIKKQKPVKEWPHKFRVHMFNIHEEFKETRQIITLNKVYIYFNKLHESQQMYLLNYKEGDEKKSSVVENVLKEVVDETVATANSV